MYGISKSQYSKKKHTQSLSTSMYNSNQVNYANIKPVRLQTGKASQRKENKHPGASKSSIGDKSL